MAAETDKAAGELRNWPVFFTHSDRVRIGERAARNRRTAEQEVLYMLAEAEKLDRLHHDVEADITPEIQDKIDTVKSKVKRVEPED